MKKRFFTALPVILAFILSMDSSMLPTQAGELAWGPKPDNPTATDGKPLGWPFLISDQSVDTMDPVVAYNSQRHEYLAVWWNDRPGCDDIYGQRLTKDGMLIGSWFAIVAGCPGERWYPDIVYNTQHDEYLIVWGYSATPTTAPFCIQGQRISGTGVLMGGLINITNCNVTTNYDFNPTVDYAAPEDKYLVVWEGRATAATTLDVRGQVVGSGGGLSGGMIIIAQGSAGFSFERPDLAYNHKSNNYLVAWQQRDLGANLYDIYARLVSGDGVPLQPPSIEIIRVSTNQMNPAVAAMPSASSLGQFMVAWDFQYTAIDRDIAGRLISGDGSMFSNVFMVSVLNEDQRNPAVASNESSGQYLVTWTEFSLPPFIFSSIQGQVINSAGTFLGAQTNLGGLVADHSSVSRGPLNHFFIGIDDTPLTTNRDIWGVLWGNRLYLPLVTK